MKKLIISHAIEYDTFEIRKHLSTDHLNFTFLFSNLNLGGGANDHLQRLFLDHPPPPEPKMRQ